MIYRYKEHIPHVHQSAFIADGAKIIGDVTIGEQSSVWFNVVLRGDEGPIKIGNQCSIQDNTVIHLYSQFPVILEDEVTIGHNAIIHGCTLKKRVLVGMGATILDGVIVGENSIIGANALVPSGKVIPPNSIVFGNQGEVVKHITDRHREMIEQTVTTYVRNARQYSDKTIFEKVDEEL